MTIRSNKSSLLGMTAAAALLALPALAQTQPAPRDGTAGNPPSTATQRAADSVTGNRTPADGTPGNPPGTALGRAVDRAGDNAASANQRAGDPANTQNRPDGTPGNPPGTALGRAADRALGTNMSGAYPQNSDGTPNNPPGTAAGRAVDRATTDNGTTHNNATGGMTAQGNNAGTPRQQNGQPGPVNTMPDGSQARAGTMSAPLQNQAAGNAPANPSGPSGAPANSTGYGNADRPATATAGNPAAGSTTAAPMAQTDRVSKIIGSNVYNERNESIGSVDDVILGSGNASPLAVVSVGGFLGIGAKLVAVPMTDLRWSAADNRWTITGATKESLTSLPAYSYDSARRG
ncbi:PRC-barrel domain-containing protein [Pararoseomonas indoligenes]|uniref:PRC-barrel domain-containing protein n=1 Tax=Roseomonas indoligenes TaxID=2820811 RepID=A0A940S4K4_9PROT|nr:PRC-barrel domain-containing protein [Pararoseomonas indoligenes]MBP0492070.1 PRC-barrel domain-containing protein [Pararoseomonas indoligenes]